MSIRVGQFNDLPTLNSFVAARRRDRRQLQTLMDMPQWLTGCAEARAAVARLSLSAREFPKWVWRTATPQVRAKPPGVSVVASCTPAPRVTRYAVA
jgi:hypothetical protein